MAYNNQNHNSVIIYTLFEIIKHKAYINSYILRQISFLKL